MRRATSRKARKDMRSVWVLVTLALALGGCVGMGPGVIPQTRYFLIDYTIARAKHSGKILPVSIGVEDFRSDSVYRSDRIVFRKSPYQLDFYPYEKWGARPEQIVTDLMLEHLLATGRFDDVVRATGGPQVDYLIRGRVKRFEEVDQKGSYLAVAQIEFSVSDRKTGRVLLQDRIMGTKLAKTKPPQGFVTAMAENLRNLLGDAAKQIVKTVSLHSRRGAPRP